MISSGAVFLDWLGPGGRPPPLDQFLARSALPRATTAGVERLCARAVSVAGLAFARVEDGGARLADQLRRIPRPVLDRAAGPDLLPELREARANARDWRTRCVAFGIPPGFAPYLSRWAERGGASEAWLEAQDRRPPLWVRARHPEAAEELRAGGFVVEVGPGDALRVEGTADIRRSEAYVGGRIEIQDVSSQHLGALGVVKRSDRIWDLCAGRGGKTLQLDERLGGRGVVCATDIDAKKLDELKLRVRRAGLADLVRIRQWDGEAVPDFGPEVKRGFKLAFVDAPCSASGTWRRNPDARLRTDPEKLPTYAELQRKLFALAREATPDGAVVYGTCSVFVEEDEDVVPGGVRFGPPLLDGDTMYGAVG
jgi:16S rRNA (cytosine967-C5)-methyltransferase